ncbi:uncharacterized protein SOCE836_028610 [Sorangium cellulosum]|uniref:Uncharacterized protein n=1 Tax=Sorangium cellulosum TaxID=56 RepID=A0A4P2QL97_SORCE|nr:uncharacterized protein SOCE836_028610 [Sorangium cellulosum]WCQ90129.1 hypothetical protein NQZ70_02830 [Sorangium sp. Soce836]
MSERHLVQDVRDQVRRRGNMRRPRHDGQKPPLPLFLRLGAAVQARVHAYRIDWEARAA